MKRPAPSVKPKRIGSTQTHSFEFNEVCEDVLWAHETSAHHRPETNGFVERAVRSVEDRLLFWYSVVFQIGGGVTQWRIVAVCVMFMTPSWTKKTSDEKRHG